MSVFEPIKTRTQLRELCEKDPMNVGVSQSGELFAYDFERNTEVKISKEQASERLGLPLDIIEKVVKHNGHFEVPEPIVEEPDEEEVPFADPEYFEDEPEVDDDPVVEVQPEPEEEAVPEEEEEDTMNEQLCIMESKIDRLTSLVEQLLEVRLEDAKVLNEVNEKLL